MKQMEKRLFVGRTLNNSRRKEKRRQEKGREERRGGVVVWGESERMIRGKRNYERASRRVI